MMLGVELKEERKGEEHIKLDLSWVTLHHSMLVINTLLIGGFFENIH